MLDFFASRAHGFLTDGKEALRVAYEGLPGENAGEIKENFLEKLKTDAPGDIEKGYTRSGVHKDDIALTVGGTDIRAFGSQGQQQSPKSKVNRKNSRRTVRHHLHGI